MSVKASSTARTWTVDDNGPADFDNIQEAINNASSGDTVFVHIGTYYEHVVINKTITLIGEDNNFTIIDGNKTNNVINIKANNVTVKNFTITKSGLDPYGGILVDHSTGNVIINNKIIYNYEGISILYSSNNVVCSNYISSNNDGIYLYSSSSNVFSGNNITLSTYDGIYLYYSSSNEFSGNAVLYNNFSGMSFYYSSSNVVCGNTIIGNNDGIKLALSSINNTIYHNNFNNANQAVSKSTNVWSYGGEGNYWSDYTEQDLNEDGIGDASYDIDMVNKDRYPLMGMFSEFSVALERQVYSVTVISNSTISLFKFQIGAETGNKIIHFDTTGGADTVGFCRVKIPTTLMNYPHIVMVDGEEIIPKVLNVSNEEYAYLYFTYLQKDRTITIISSKTLALYSELLENYGILLSNYTQLSILNSTYYELLDNYLKLQIDLHDLNQTYHTLSESYNILLYNYSQLQVSFHELNDSYLKHLLDYSKQMQNIQNLTYVLVGLTAILIITTVYLSKRVHTKVATKISTVEEK
jgi:parallel beta-helix repeat protein